MALHHGNDIVRRGLLVSLDARNQRSYSGTGASWADLSGKGNHGTIEGSIPHSTNGYFSFGGPSSGHYVNINGLSNYDYDSSITVIISHYNVGGDYRGLINNGYATTPTFEFRYGREDFFGGSNNGTRLGVRVNPVSGSGLALDINAELNVWGVFGLTYDGETMTVYKNGEVFGSASLPGTTRVLNVPVVIGHSSLSVGHQALSGNVSFAQIYDVALTPGEIQQNFNASRARFGL